jgi:N-acetylglucosamine kinase-like BadF-type ATPase
VLRAILDHWGLDDPEQLLERVYGAETAPAGIAELALPLLGVAAAGDAAARELVHEAAGALARHVDAVVRKLDLRRPPVALGGGLLSGSAELREGLRSRLESDVGPVSLVTDPTDGALLIARRLMASPPARAVNGS